MNFLPSEINLLLFNFIKELDANLRILMARAEVVVKVLVSSYGVEAKRRAVFEVGSLLPVASNQTEEGRAKNCRVELVEQ